MENEYVKISEKVNRVRNGNNDEYHDQIYEKPNSRRRHRNSRRLDQHQQSVKLWEYQQPLDQAQHLQQNPNEELSKGLQQHGQFVNYLPRLKNNDQLRQQNRLNEKKTFHGGRSSPD